jgi:hypothetical protein
VFSSISYESFYDELEKIAQEREEGKPPVTKKRLKQMAIALPVIAAGSGLGYVTGRGIRSLMMKHLKPKVVEEAAKRNWGPKIRKAMPAIAGGLAGAVGAAHLMRRKKIKEWIEKDEAKRPEQHGS